MNLIGDREETIMARRNDAPKRPPVEHLACPEGMDASVFRSLPIDIQRQLVEDQNLDRLSELRGSVRMEIEIMNQQARLLRESTLFQDSIDTSYEGEEQTAEDQNGASNAGQQHTSVPTGVLLSSLDPDGLIALPADIREEVLGNEEEQFVRRDNVMDSLSNYGEPDDGADYNGSYNESGRRHGYGQLITKRGERYEGQLFCL